MNPNAKLAIAAILGSLLTIAVVKFALPDGEGKTEQEAATDTRSTADAAMTGTNAPPTAAAATNSVPTATTNAIPPGGPLPGSPPAGPQTAENKPDDGQSGGDKKEEEDDGLIQLSFKGAQIDMVIDWLAKTSGKSVVKHPQVNVQLTIMNPKKMPVRDAIDLVYSALSLQGFNAVESRDTIYIVPEGKEPKLNPEFIDGSTELPEGRQKVMKVFTFENIPANEVKERLKGVFSEGAVVEVDDRGNRLIVTDFTDNIRLLNELIPELDQISTADTTIRIYAVKHLEAYELANLLNMVLSGQAMPAPSSSSSSSRRSPSRSSRISFPPGFPQPPSSSGSAPAMVTPEGEVRFWPDANSNRLIVSAPQSELPRIEDLIETLDVEKPADVAVRVLPLQHVDATQLVREIAPLYQRMSGNSLKDIIEVTANERSNSLIILSSESNFNAIRAFIKGLDSEDAQEKVIKTFKLTNADAQDVAEQLKELNTSGNSNTRYSYIYYYPGTSSNSRQKTQVVADRRQNSVIVQAAPADIPGIARMIEELDRPITDDSLAPRIFPLTYVEADSIKDVLDELFLKKEETRDYWDSYYYGGSQDESQDVGRLYGKVRITSETYSNSIIVTANSIESLEAVEKVLKELDTPSQAGDSTLRVPLRFAEAISIANNLNILFAKGGSPPIQGGGPQNNQQNQNNQNQNNNPSQNGFQLEEEREETPYFPWLGGQQDNGFGADGRTTRPPSDLVGRVRVVPDKRSNSILLTANIHYFPQVLKLINELDAPTAQVLIEAKIIEVSSDFRDKFGVRWSPDGDQAFDADDLDGSFLGSAGTSYTDTFISEALRTGVLDANVNLDVLIQFLKKNTDTTVLGEPQINVADNELGKLFVGAQVPFIASSLNSDTGGRNDNFQYKDVGIILEVTPQINNSEDIALKIRAESSSVRSGETILGGAIIDTRNFRTEILLKDGETAVLGGIIQSQDGEIIRKVPILGDIPILGWAFKKKDKVTKNVELMVFLRPHVSRTPEEAAEILRNIRSKTPGLQRWEELRKEERDDDTGKD